MESTALRFDFGTGRLYPVAHAGRQWVRFDDLVRFLDGDRAVMLAETRDSSFSDKLAELPDGTVLLPWEGIPVWMFVPSTEAIGPDNRDGHTAWCRKVIDSGAFSELGRRIAADLGIAPRSPADRRRLTSDQLAAMARHEAAVTGLFDAMPPPNTSPDGRTLYLGPADDRPELRAAADRHVALLAAALRYVVAQGLTHPDYGREMIRFTFAGQAYWIWRSRAEHLAEAPDSLGAAVLEAAGYGAGADVPADDDRELSPDQFARVVGMESVMRGNLLGGRSPAGRHVLEVAVQVLRNPRRRRRAVRHVELMAAAVRYLAAEHITPALLADVAPSYPLTAVAAAMLADRDGLAATPGTLGHTVLVAAGLLPRDGG